MTKHCEASLLRAIEDGLPLKHAAMLAGISYDTLNRWRKRGELENAPLRFRQFCKALRHSEAVAMKRLVNGVSAAGKTDWRAAAWILERRFREEFGKPHEAENKQPTENRVELLRRWADEAEYPVQKGILENLAVREVFKDVCRRIEAKREEKKTAEKERQRDLAVKQTRLRE
jgi:hypothetical protein